MERGAYLVHGEVLGQEVGEACGEDAAVAAVVLLWSVGLCRHELPVGHVERGPTLLVLVLLFQVPEAQQEKEYEFR